MAYKKYDNDNRKKDKTFTGTVQATDKGFAFIIPDEDFGHDFFVPKKSVNGAYHGDEVLAAHVNGTRDEAYIIKILKRANTVIVGTLQKSGRAAYLFPDNLKLPRVFIPLSETMGARTGEKVVAEITSYPKNKAPGGKVTEILGEEGDFETEELSIIRSYGLEEEFPDRVLKEAQSVSAEKVVLGNRRDLRNELIITIDGEDTRDIDDGVSLTVENGLYRLGVHIADVSHYVRPRTALDDNAYERGTSVYFPDRVLPMLPKELSNGACSLNENSDRYALSCVMTLKPDGERVNYEIFESVIRSSHRTTYAEITAVCNGEKAACDKYPDLIETVKDMKNLCLALEKRREARGAVSLDVKEAHIFVNDRGEIVIPKAERTLSQRIIEQFMVSANEAVAEFLQKKNSPCLYRIHESPSPEKAGAFFSFLKDLGIKPHGTANDLEPKDFQSVLNACADKPFYSIVNKVMLRSMQKARYCEENLGHFGLASRCYCHFTSPIRRYPDLFVHRSLKEVLRGGNANKLYAKHAKSAGADCSARERIADECERKVDELYKLAYMSERLGEDFDATISGVTSFGVFCELDNTVEGMIPIEDLPKDEYVFYEEKYLLKGNRRSFRLGDKVRVTVADCDLGRLRVIFALAKNKQPLTK